MNPREKVLGIGNLYIRRGEPIPIDILAEADRLGLSVTDFDQPSNPQTEDNANFHKETIDNG